MWYRMGTYGCLSNVSFSSQCLIFISVISEIQGLVHGLICILFFQDNMIVNIHNHSLTIPQELGNSFDGYSGNLITQLRTIVMPKYMGCQACYWLFRDVLQALEYPCPHLIVRAFRDRFTATHNKNIRPATFAHIITVCFKGWTIT